MGLLIDLEPITNVTASSFAKDIVPLVDKNIQALEVDFPKVPLLYGNPRKAERVIRDRQEQMQGMGGLAVYVVHLGWRVQADGEQDLPMRLAGMAVSRRGNVPQALNTAPTDFVGRHFSLWLDTYRPPELRRVGIPLMEKRMHAEASDTNRTGNVWTLILPSNLASTYTWQHPGYIWGGFERVGTETIYPELDNQYFRQLYVSRFTLAQIGRTLGIR